MCGFVFVLRILRKILVSFVNALLLFLGSAIHGLFSMLVMAFSSAFLVL